MAEFVFTKDFDSQIDDFKKFVGNPDEVKSVDVTCTIGNEVMVAEFANITAKISENLAEDTKVEFKIITDETLNSDETMVKVKILED